MLTSGAFNKGASGWWKIQPSENKSSYSVYKALLRLQPYTDTLGHGVQSQRWYMWHKKSKPVNIKTWAVKVRLISFMPVVKQAVKFSTEELQMCGLFPFNLTNQSGTYSHLSPEKADQQLLTVCNLQIRCFSANYCEKLENNLEANTR